MITSTLQRYLTTEKRAMDTLAKVWLHQVCLNFLIRHVGNKLKTHCAKKPTGKSAKAYSIFDKQK